MKVFFFSPLILALCSSPVNAQAKVEKETTSTSQAKTEPAEAGAHHQQWQVVDEVSAKELEGAPNTTRHRSQAHADAPQDPATPSAAPEAGELRTGCGGGITGGASGLALKRDGQLSSWRRERAGSSRPIRTLALGTDAEAAVRLFERAISGGFNTLVFREAGNRTCWVELTMSGATHGVYWVEPKRAPALAVELFEGLNAVRRGLSANSASPVAPAPVKKPSDPR